MTSKLILDAKKINLAMANACLDPYEFCKQANIHYSSYLRVSKGESVKPATAGKIAKALDVKVEDLMQT